MYLLSNKVDEATPILPTADLPSSPRQRFLIFSSPLKRSLLVNILSAHILILILYLLNPAHVFRSPYSSLLHGRHRAKAPKLYHYAPGQSHIVALPSFNATIGVRLTHQKLDRESFTQVLLQASNDIMETYNSLKKEGKQFDMGGKREWFERAPDEDDQEMAQPTEQAILKLEGKDHPQTSSGMQSDEKTKAEMRKKRKPASDRKGSARVRKKRDEETKDTGAQEQPDAEPQSSEHTNADATEDGEKKEETPVEDDKQEDSPPAQEDAAPTATTSDDSPAAASSTSPSTSSPSASSPSNATSTHIPTRPGVFISLSLSPPPSPAKPSDEGSDPPALDHKLPIAVLQALHRFRLKPYAGDLFVKDVHGWEFGRGCIGSDEKGCRAGGGVGKEDG